MLELINKRILQFSGVFGLSDAMMGDFGADVRGSLTQTLDGARTKNAIERAHQETLDEFAKENKQVVCQAKHALFSSFNKKVADSVAITPEYITKKVRGLNDDLWTLTRWFFSGKQGFTLNESTRTITRSATLQGKVFTGKRMGRNEYSMAQGYRPSSGRHTITGALARSIIGETFWQAVPEFGDIVVDVTSWTQNNTTFEPCRIGLYLVQVKPESVFWGGYTFSAFTGKTTTGRILSDAECRRVMALPVLQHSSYGQARGPHNRHQRTQQSHELDSLLDTQVYIQKTLTEMATAEREELERLRSENAEAKLALERALEQLRGRIKTEENKQQADLPRLEKLEAQRTLAVLRKELQQSEQNRFMDSLKLDMMLEERVQCFLNTTRLKATWERQFVIGVVGA